MLIKKAVLYNEAKMHLAAIPFVNICIPSSLNIYDAFCIDPLYYLTTTTSRQFVNYAANNAPSTEPFTM